MNKDIRYIYSIFCSLPMPMCDGWWSWGLYDICNKLGIIY